MLEKQQKRKKECMQFFYQLGFILILYGENNGNLKKNNNTYQVIYLLSLYLRLQITSQQVLSLNFKPK